MNKQYKGHINKLVALLSILAGLLCWLGCRYAYTTYHEKLPGPLLIASIFAALFAAIFLTVWIGSVISGSFDTSSARYNDTKGMITYFLIGLLAVFGLSMGLEYLYELNPHFKAISPSSYIFVLDQSGSMEGNDPAGLRYDAIPEIMEAERNGFPYMVYTFSNETELVREMGPYDPEEEAIPVVSNGGTSIMGTIRQILDDYKNGVWDGGENPKVVFLTDGVATDFNKGLLWFKGDMPQFLGILDEYQDLGIHISTVGLGLVDRDIMSAMAETTGGVFVHIQDASSLASAMKTAATSYSDRDLLSIRYLKRLDLLYAFLRILFLALIGTVLGSLMVFAYMEDSSIPLIILSSAVSSLAGSTLFELGLKIGIFQNILWIILWGLFSLTLGYIYPHAKKGFTGYAVLAIKKGLFINL